MEIRSHRHWNWFKTRDSNQMDKIKNIKEEASHSQYIKAEMEPWPSKF